MGFYRSLIVSFKEPFKGIFKDALKETLPLRGSFRVPFKGSVRIYRDLLGLIWIPLRGSFLRGLRPKEAFDCGEASPTLTEVLRLQLLSPVSVRV